MARKSFLLRINQELWHELEKWASDELRSVNGQIEYLLRESVVRRRNKELQQNDAESTKNEKEE